MSEWVMTERKLIEIEERRTVAAGVVSVVGVTELFNPGDPAPPGHEGRPSTRRIESPASDRMDRGEDAVKRQEKPRRRRAR